MKRSKLDNDGIIGLLVPSIIGVMACMVSLVGLTLAWFSTNKTINNQSIVAANFDVDVSVYLASDMTLIEDTNGIYDLMAGTYNIALKRIGSAMNSSGYCSIKIGDKVYSSVLLKKDEILNFNLVVDSQIKVMFEPIWGEAPIENTNIINNNDVVSILDTVIE